VIAPAPTVVAPVARRLRLRLPATVAAAALLGVAAGGIAWTTSSHSRPAAIALPQLHGVASWDPGARPAPAFRIRGTAGVEPLSVLRGRPVVVAFDPPGCTAACTSMRSLLRQIVARLAPAERPVVVTVGGAGALTAVSPAAVLARFSVTGSTPLVYLLDRSGDERTGYLFPFAPAFVQGDLRTLAEEGR
jgi:hypothetical protein